MERKKFAQIESERKFKRSSFQRKGIPPHLNKKRTLAEKIKRQKMAQRDKTDTDSEEDECAERIPFHENDLRYCRIKEDTRRHSNAIVICIMDTSGSMDQTKKYLARSFYFCCTNLCAGNMNM